MKPVTPHSFAKIAALSRRELPIVLACSGCSSAGQLAGRVALELDRRGVAEMSCLAGVGAAKPMFLKKLRDREVWVIDGCPIHCGVGVLERVGGFPCTHLRLHDFGIRKNAEPPEGEEFHRLVDTVLAEAGKAQEAGAA